MKTTIEYKGKQVTVDIPDAELEKLVEEKKTGYERVSHGDYYYSFNSHSKLAMREVETEAYIDNDRYENGNYYSDKTLAENNARVDRLLRNLRRFAVEHRMNEVNWNDYDETKYILYYNYTSRRLEVGPCYYCRDVAGIYFDTKDTAELAIEEFKDELTWYFTEYRDSL